MIILFILAGGFVLKCVLNTSVMDSYCAIADYKAFGALVSSGVLEMIFELRGLMSIFQKKDKRNDE